MWSGEDPDMPPIPLLLGKLEISVPIEGLLVDYVYVFKQRGAWKSWPELAKREEIEASDMGVLVPTLDSCRYVHMLAMHLKVHDRFSQLFKKNLKTSFNSSIKNECYLLDPPVRVKVFTFKII